jgi:hypothetical protein
VGTATGDGSEIVTRGTGTGVGLDVAVGVGLGTGLGVGRAGRVSVAFGEGEASMGAVELGADVGATAIDSVPGTGGRVAAVAVMRTGEDPESVVSAHRLTSTVNDSMMISVNPSERRLSECCMVKVPLTLR